MGTQPEPHRGETKDPDKQQTSTGTGATEDTGADLDDMEKAKMRPTGSGGSAPPSQSR